jgi:hypothetical protein
LRRELADEDRHGHFLAAIDGEADFVFAGFWDLEAGDADNDGRAGGGSAGRDLYLYLLGRRWWLEFLAVGIDDGKFYFFEAFFNFSETEFGDDVTSDGNGELGHQYHVSSAKDVKFALDAGPRGETKGEDFGRHAGRVNQKGKGKKEKFPMYGLSWRLTLT